MTQHNVRAGALRQFAQALQRQERSQATVEKYCRDAAAFLQFLAPHTGITKAAVQAWKQSLVERGYAVSSINSMLAAVNSFLVFLGAGDCRVKRLKCQRRLFREQSRELSRQEYLCLVAAAQNRGQERLALLLQSLGATGMRVSELQFLTIEALRQGRVCISLKGKTRTILLPAKLCHKLLNYAGRQHICYGPVFVGRRGGPLNRKTIWAEMKKLCAQAGVEPSKVFPHNLRHLFAQAFYAVDQDLARLADVLGHSSIETTRVYILSSGREHLRKLDSLGLVV